MSDLLAVDLGVRTGLAVYGGHGRLVSYRSRNFGSGPRLKRAIPALLEELPGLNWIVIEGGGPLACAWLREGLRRGLQVRQIGTEAWRERLLYARQRRTGEQAKQAADSMARRVIDWSGAPRPTSLRHDAAEAILIGLWGVLEFGLLGSLPREVQTG